MHYTNRLFVSRATQLLMGTGRDLVPKPPGIVPKATGFRPRRPEREEAATPHSYWDCGRFAPIG